MSYSDDSDETNDIIYYIDSFELLEESKQILEKLQHYIYSNGLEMLASNESLDGMMNLISST